MNGCSASEVARDLHTSVPRVMRAARRLGFVEAEPIHRRLCFSAAQVRALRSELGVGGTGAGLGRIETAALAALTRAPFGLPSARAVAEAAGVSPAASARAVRSLSERGLITSRPAHIAAGRARRVQMLRANLGDPGFDDELHSVLRQVRPPAKREERVPFGLSHLFWNSAPEQLELPHGGPYIARRLLRTMDAAGLAWGARNLRASDWRSAATARGLDEPVRALALNLAAADG